MILVASCPSGNISNFLVSYSRAATRPCRSRFAAFSMLGSIFFTPFNLAFWGQLKPHTRPILHSVSLSPWQVLGTIVVLLGIPTVLRMWVSHRYAGFAERARGPFRALSLVFFVLFAGFKRAQGDIVITLDADLQDLPEEIPSLLRKMDEGFDLISGWKIKRKDSLIRKVASRLFNGVTSFFTGVKLHDFNCGLKCYRKELIDELILYGELHRYIPAIANWKGFRVGEVKVDHHPRMHGVSKFGSERYLRGLFDLLTVIMLTKYPEKPLHFFGLLGTILSLAGMAELRLKHSVLRESLARAGAPWDGPVTVHASPQTGWRMRASLHVARGDAGLRLGLRQEGSRRGVDL